MSELFGWLNQSEGKKGRKKSRARPQLVGTQTAVAGDDPGISSGVSVLPDVVVPRTEIRSTVQFDLGGADYRLKTVLDPLSLVGEQFRRLRASLSLIQKQRQVKVLLVTSAGPGEGKTFAACSLAGVLAQEPERKVLLIDADLRRPRAGKQIGMRGDPGAVQGFAEVLRGECDLLDSIAGALEGNLFFLPSGKIPANPSELLTSPEMDETIKTARSVFDWVVVDSPPVLALSDASVLAPACDAVLFVVQAAVTPSKLIQQAVQRIGRERVCGIIMNRVKYFRASGYYYHYYHDRLKA